MLFDTQMMRSLFENQEDITNYKGFWKVSKVFTVASNRDICIQNELAKMNSNFIFKK